MISYSNMKRLIPSALSILHTISTPTQIIFKNSANHISSRSISTKTLTFPSTSFVSNYKSFLKSKEVQQTAIADPQHNHSFLFSFYNPNTTSTSDLFSLQQSTSIPTLFYPSYQEHLPQLLFTQLTMKVASHHYTNEDSFSLPSADYHIATSTACSSHRTRFQNWIETHQLSHSVYFHPLSIPSSKIEFFTLITLSSSPTVSEETHSVLRTILHYSTFDMITASQDLSSVFFGRNDRPHVSNSPIVPLEDPFSTYSFPLLLSSTRPRSSLFFPSTTIHYPILYPCDCYLITKLISQPTKAFLVLQQSFSPSHGVVGLLNDLHDCDDQGRCICDLRLLDRCILDSACPSDDLYQNHCVSVRLLRDFDQKVLNQEILALLSSIHSQVFLKLSSYNAQFCHRYGFDAFMNLLCYYGSFQKTFSTIDQLNEYVFQQLSQRSISSTDYSFVLSTVLQQLQSTLKNEVLYRTTSTKDRLEYILHRLSDS